MPDINIELYREDGSSHRDVALTVRDNGAVHRQDQRRRFIDKISEVARTATLDAKLASS